MRLIYCTDFSEQFPYRILSGIYRYAQETGVPWAVCRMPSDLRFGYDFKQLVQWALQWRADVVVGQFEPENDVQEFRRNGIVVIAQDFIKPFSGIPNLTADYALQGAMAAERFMARGYREYAFFGNNGMCWSDARRDGFRARLEEAGHAGHIHIYKRKRIDNLWSYRQDLLQPWLLSLPKPVGIMACDDNQAAILVEACNVLGIRIPYDAAIIGVDNDEVTCNLSTPPISSIDVDIERGGYELAAMADEMVRNPENPGHDIVLHPMHIATRASSNTLTTQDVAVHDALTFIHSHLDRKITVSDVLKHVPLSRRLLEQRFLKATGATIYHYISEQRINYFAGMLLTSKESIANLAARFDEPDAKALSRRFKALRGCTPSQFRKKNLRKLGD